MLAKELVKTCTFAQTNRLWHFTALPNTCERLCLQLLKAAYRSSVLTNSYSEPIMMPNMDWSKSKYAYIQYCRWGEIPNELVCFWGYGTIGQIMNIFYPCRSVKSIERAAPHLDNVCDQLKQALFLQQQIKYENARR